LDDDPRFKILSPGIRAKIRIEMNHPVLSKARIFGWHPHDIEEEKGVRKVFDKIDTDDSGKLDR